MVRTRYDACKILGVNINSSKEEWKTAYRNICKRFHPDNLDTNLMNGASYISLAKEALDFLMNEKVAVINNNSNVIKNSKTKNPGKIYGTSDHYRYNHDDYKKFQKKMNDKAKTDKANKIIELKAANDKIREDERKRKEKELLDQIRWLRIASIIHETIENDKRK